MCITRRSELNPRRKPKNGFTLLEIMAVTVIIGILAAVAIPMVTKYLQKSKSSEAGLNIRKIYDGEIAYFAQMSAGRQGEFRESSFVALDPEPPVPRREKQKGNFSEGNWPLINFSPDGPVLFSYSVQTSGLGVSSAFTARAEGDFNEDGIKSLYERTAAIDSNTGEMVGGAGLYVLEEFVP